MLSTVGRDLHGLGPVGVVGAKVGKSCLGTVQIKVWVYVVSCYDHELD